MVVVWRGCGGARGWRVNVSKTVCGVGYYEQNDDARQRLLLDAKEVFRGLLPDEMVQSDGQVLLGTPLGVDSADIHVGSAQYRVRKLRDMIDAHDDRLRGVVQLARRAGLTGSSTQRISVQLSQLLLRWCCNTRNVHLLRGLPLRLVQEVASLHDQAIKVACAASLGMVDVEVLQSTDHLHSVPDTALPPSFLRAYDQVQLDVAAGGHGLRAWARHADARKSWRKAMGRRADDVEFVPFSIEAGGVWGPAARKFFRECLALADDDRDVDLYHWSSTRFSRAWFDSLSVLVARGRAKVSVDAAASDWPKRIRDMQHIDHEDYAADYD